jgi:hypothetical protein
MGRPTKLTPETEKKIAEAIAMGATYELASMYGGISYDSFALWMKRGEKEFQRLEGDRAKPKETEAPFCRFFMAIKLAEGQAAVRWLGRIEQAARDGEWTAAAWKLERRYPQMYGRRAIEVSGPEGGPVQVVSVQDVVNAREQAQRWERERFGQQGGAPDDAPDPAVR